MSKFGYCPVCGLPGTRREKLINGFTLCDNGHNWRVISAEGGNYFVAGVLVEPVRDNKMTPEQKEQFTRGIVSCCTDKDGIYCPSNFGMENFKNELCRHYNCEKCASQACEKFFEENGL
jgi:hypothetical protein